MTEPNKPADPLEALRRQQEALSRARGEPVTPAAPAAPAAASAPTTAAVKPGAAAPKRNAEEAPYSNEGRGHTPIVRDAAPVAAAPSAPPAAQADARKAAPATPAEKPAVTASKPSAKPAGSSFDPATAAMERFLIALGEKNERVGGPPAQNYHFMISKDDGRPDDNYRVALRNFQEERGIEPTGRLDKETRLAVQRLVQESGGDLGRHGVDGIIGRDTIRAMDHVSSLTTHFARTAEPRGEPVTLGVTPVAAPASEDWNMREGGTVRVADTLPDTLGDFIRCLPAMKDGGPGETPAASEPAAPPPKPLRGIFRPGD